MYFIYIYIYVSMYIIYIYIFMYIDIYLYIYIYIYTHISIDLYLYRLMVHGITTMHPDQFRTVPMLLASLQIYFKLSIIKNVPLNGGFKLNGGSKSQFSDYVFSLNPTVRKLYIYIYS